MIGTMNKYLIGLFCSFCLLALPVCAEEYTVDIQGFYAHPITGIIEDSGGEANAALGQSMVEGVVGSLGLLETDLEENQYLAFTFHLMDSISEVSIETQGSNSDTWNLVAHEEVADGEDQKSFVIPIPSQSTLLRVKLFVLPMGRSVVFFMGAGNASTGNKTDIPATKQNVSGSSTTTTTTTTSSTSSLGDVDGMVLSVGSATSTAQTSAPVSPENKSTDSISTVDILFLIVAANLISGLFLAVAFFLIRHIVRTEVIIHEVKQLHRYSRYTARRLEGSNRVLELGEQEPVSALPPEQRYEDFSEEDWAEHIYSQERSRV